MATWRILLLFLLVFLCFPLFLSLLLLCCCCSCCFEMLCLLLSYMGIRHWNYSLKEPSNHLAVPSPPNLAERWIPFPWLIAETRLQWEFAGALVHKPCDIWSLSFVLLLLGSQGIQHNNLGISMGTGVPFLPSVEDVRFLQSMNLMEFPTALGLFPFLTWGC